MSGRHEDPFSSAGRFFANPHLDDYVHSLDFQASGNIEMVDGAGQVLTALVRGRYAVEQLGLSQWVVRLTDLVAINPYYKHRRFRGLEIEAYFQATQGYVPHEEQDVVGRLDPISVHVIREEGSFLLRQQVSWKISDAQEWPYLLCPERYRFDADPLASLASNRAGNLYYMFRAAATDEDIYYATRGLQQITARQLAERGILPDAGPT